MRKKSLVIVLLLLLFSVAGAPEEDFVTLRFRVKPANAKIYRTGSAKDTQNERPTLLCSADEAYLVPISEVPDQLLLLFRAEGYQDKLQSFNMAGVRNQNPFYLPADGSVLVLESAKKNYIPHALVLMGLAIGAGGFFFLRARHQKVQDISAWVEENKVSSSDEDALLGKRVGDYWLLQQLGRGGMATVYRAVREGDPEKQDYAIKLVHPHVASGDDFKTRFQREVSIGDQLNHPSIVTVHDAGLENGHYFIALEFIEGRELRQQIPPEGCSLDKTLKLLIPIFDAVAFAHARDIVHRDLKPENVLIDAKGHIKLSDFGLARSRQFSTVTVTGSVLGTPGYIAPEQLTQGGPNPLSDQYALGIMAFEIATGRLPFDGEDAMAILFQHLQTPPPAPSSLKSEIPPEFDTIVLRMLEKDPEKRFASVSEAKQELEKLV